MLQKAEEACTWEKLGGRDGFCNVRPDRLLPKRALGKSGNPRSGWSRATAPDAKTTSCAAPCTCSCHLHSHFGSAAGHNTCQREGLATTVDLDLCVILFSLTEDTASCGGKNMFFSLRTVAFSFLAYGGGGWDKFQPRSGSWFSVNVPFSF